MKNTYLKFSVLFSALLLLTFFLSKQFNGFSDEISELKKSHKNHLENNPFKETLKLSKAERKAKGIPPNKYYEQEWLLTMNPALGRPTPENVKILQEELRLDRLAGRVPGDAGDNMWVERGPNNVGGRTRAVLFDPNDPTNETVFAGGVSGGLWVNSNISNSSSSWSQVSGVPGNLAVNCITADPNNSQIMYLGTGEVYTWGAVNGNGIYKSTDGGNTWSQIYGAPTGNVANDIVYVQDIIAWNNPNTNQTEIFFGADAMAYTEASPYTWLGTNTIGLYRSTDGGSTFNTVNLGSTFAPNSFDVDFAGKLWMGTKYCYATGSGGGTIFYTTNGSTWTQATQYSGEGRVQIAASKQIADKVYALIETRAASGDQVRIISTTDGFTNITDRSIPNDADTGIASTDFTRGQAFFDLVIAIDPNNDDILYTGGIDLFKSIDSGTNWTQLTHWYGGFGFQNVHADQHAIEFADGSSTKMAFGNDGGMYFSDNSGTNITSRNTNYNVTQFYKGAIGSDTASEKLLAGAQDNGVQLINNASSGIGSSSQISGGDGCFVFIDKDNEYMISSYVYNYYSYHNYNTGALIYDIATNQTDGDFVNPAGLDSDNNKLFTNGSAGSTYRIYRYNLGTNNATRTILTDASLTGSPTAFKASTFTTTTLFVGTIDGKLLRLDNSDSNNPTWTDISDAGFVGSVSSIELGSTEQEIYVTFHNYGVSNIWFTSDGGTTWSEKEGDLPDLPVKCIYANPLDSNEVIVGTELGVWATTNFADANPNWSQSYNGMSDVKVTSFDFRSADNTILASTFGRGMFTGQFVSTDLTANFTADNTAPNTIQTVNFTDTSVNGAISWTWSFSPSTVTYQGGTDANSQNPQVIFDAAGTYSVTLTVSDGTGTDSLTKTDYIVVTDPAYCDSEYSDAVSTDEYIDTVIFGTINNSGTGTVDGVGYFDYTNLSTDVDRSSTYTLSVTVYANYDEYASAWIDWNQDYVFDSSEKYELGFYPDSNGNVTNTVDITVPSDAVLGSTRMRITEEYNGIPAGPCTADHNSTYGETEDYTINVVDSTLSSQNQNLNSYGLSLFPTVSDGSFYLSSNTYNGNLNVKIFDISGKEVYSNNININSNQKETIDLIGKSSGFYLVNISNQEFNTTQKVIIK